MTTVRQLLQARASQVWTTRPDASVFEALQLMADKDVGALPVVQGVRLVGIISERDYARKGILKGKSSKTTSVKDLMTAEVVTVRPEHSVERCMALMSRHRIRHLPVLTAEQLLVGVVSIRDVVGAVIENQTETIERLEGRRGDDLY
ncbi:MAG: CBS domain-containing protein [Anaerolineales bacterium]|nr:CBS domain-containing protein [Anaerolineales bacterium]